MSLYQKLLTTSQPTFIVEGNEGFVDSVVGFIQKIIQKILDGIKWIWNLITGGGDSGAKSAEKMSKEVDKAVSELPKKMREVNRQLDKVAAKSKAVSNKSKETGRKIDEVLSKGNSGKISKDEMFAEFDKIMKGDGLEGEEKTATVKVIKEVNAEFTKVMKDNGIKVTSGAAKEGAAIVAAAVLQDKPIPEKRVEDMTGIGYASNLVMWSAKTKKLENAQDVEIDSKLARPVELVNDAIAASHEQLSKLIENQIELLKSFNADVKTADVSKLTNFLDDMVKKEYFINDWLSFTFEKQDGEKSKHKFESVVPSKRVSYEKLWLNYQTFRTVNVWTNIISEKFKTFEKELERSEKVFSDMESNTPPPDSDETKTLALKLKIIYQILEHFGRVLYQVDRLYNLSCTFGSSVESYLR